MIESEDGRFQCEASVLFYCEHLDDLVVAACHEQVVSVRSDHEVARMTGCACISCLFEGAVLLYPEYGYPVIVKAVRGI